MTNKQSLFYELDSARNWLDQEFGESFFPLQFLRSIDTLTDEELISLARLNEPDGLFLAEEHFSIQRYSITHALVRYKKVVIFDTRIRKYTPSQFEWLISNNFNIFHNE